ncbi:MULTISPECIES: hypothetical protein [Burkholderia]|uniref:hypothetical protein n=1 Tax=Burkholderia TaxID=32008 RepID=UPI0012E9D269|nr:MULTISPECIES: hypothetical protein [unclassified Burkholderia]
MQFKTGQQTVKMRRSCGALVSRDWRVRWRRRSALDRSGKSIGIEAAGSQQLGRVAMFNELIRQAELQQGNQGSTNIRALLNRAERFVPSILRIPDSQNEQTSIIFLTPWYE